MKDLKHIKTLGLLAIAVLALAAAFGTASASAAPKWTASAAGLTLKTTTLESHVFTVTGSNTTCKKTEFAGKTEGTETTVQSVVPSYSECTAFGLPATVSVTNCKLTLTADGISHLVKTDTAAGAPACAIHIEASSVFGKCKVTITEQTNEFTILYTPGPGRIHIILHDVKVSDHVTESTGVCPLTVGTHTNASYTGKSEVQAEGGTIGWDA